MNVHPTAIVEDGAVLGNDVAVGAYAFIGRSAVIGDGCFIDHHATVDGRTTLGRENRLFPYASVGTAPQDLTYDQDQETFLVLGDHNVIREFVTINIGTTKEPERTTRLGNHCLIMTYSHIAHDCVLGDHIIMANGCQLGGHVRIGNYATFGGLVGVHHFASIGSHAFVGGYSRVRQDAPPFLISEGASAEVRNLNYVGLKRNGIAEGAVAELRAAYKSLFRSELVLSTAIRKFEQDHPDACEEVRYLLQFLKQRMEGSNGRYLESVLRP